MKKEYFKPTVKTVRIQHERSVMQSTSTGAVHIDGELDQGGGASKEEGDDIGW